MRSREFSPPTRHRTLDATTVGRTLATDVVSYQRLGFGSTARPPPWPIPEDDFLGFCGTVYQAFKEAVDGLAGSDQDLFLADVRILDVFIQIGHSSATARKAEEYGLILDVGPHAATYYRPDWGHLAIQHRVALARGSSIRSRVRRIKRRIGANPGVPLLRRLIGQTGPTALVVGHLSPMLEAYSVRQGWFVDNLDFATLWMDHDDRPLPPSLLDAIDTCAAKIVRACGDLGGEISIDDLKYAWIKRLQTLAGLTAGIQETVRPAGVLLGAGAPPFYRVLALANKRRGVPVIGTQHGHNAGHIVNDIICYNDYAVCTEYLCESTAAMHSAIDRAEIAVVPKVREITFSVIPNRWNNLRSRSATTRKKTTGKTAMIVGYNHSFRRAPTDVALFFSPRLDVELRMAKVLMSNGYDVIYKAHPEAPNEVDAIMRSSCQRVVRQPFIHIIDESDLLIFSYVSTTTFGEALMTETPIVVLEIEGQCWNASERVSLDSRCAWVKARLTNGLEIVFDPADLANAAMEAPMRRSDEYARRYLIPAGDIR